LFRKAGFDVGLSGRLAVGGPMISFALSSSAADASDEPTLPMREWMA